MNNINNFNIFLKKNLSENYYNFKKINNDLNNIDLLKLFNFSYKNFLNFKLNKILNLFFPIYFYKTGHIVKFINYNFIYPLKSFYYCINKGLTYSISLKIKFDIFTFKVNGYNSNISEEKIKEEYLIIPNIPFITENSTFIINGVEKTIVSNFARSPGLYFLTELKGKFENYILKLVPDYGSEIDFVLDFKNFLYLRYKKSKISLIDILKSAGLNNEEIINNFYNFIFVFFDNDLIKLKFDPDIFLNYSIPYEIKNNLNEVIVDKNVIITINEIEKIKNNNIEYILIDKNFLLNKQIGSNLYFNNYKFAKIGETIDSKILSNIINYCVKELKLIVYGSQAHSSVILTLNKTSSNFFKSSSELNNFLNNAGFNIFDFNILNCNSDYFKKLFYISDICRKKLNFYFKKNYNFKFLNVIDIINIIKILISFKDGYFNKSDFLNIGNLSFNMVGETLDKIFFDFFLKIKKKFENSYLNFKDYNLNSFFKVSNLVSKIKNFFNISRYCQYLDQINFLSEISHKRRVTFLGVIGISKKYSGFDSRDLNISHYSRLCPIETPEGINIGLVNSLAFLCKVDKYNFLVAPYYRVLNGKILKKWIYLSVNEEFNSFVAEPTTAFKNFDNIDCILSKYGDQLILTNPNLINYINVLPYQMLSISTVLIPFLENNDSNRALMASNMLRQALPLLFPSRPIISTGLEGIVAHSSSNLIFCLNKSILSYCDSRFIILKSFFNFKDSYYYNYDVYFLIKYVSSNQKTNRSQRVLKNFNNKFYPNDILADNSCTEKGEISLGQNVLTAFMPWEGYNFEDSLIVSEKIIFDDKYTSLDLIQIDLTISKISNKFEFLTKKVIKDTFGKKNLNKYGLIKLGTQVYGGDILVGKACSIVDNFEEVNPNHRLLYSIFSENSEFNYHDTSFYLPEKFSSGVVSSLEVYFSDNYILEENDISLLKFQSSLLLKSKKKKFLFLKKKIKKMIKNFLIGKKIFYNNKFMYIDFKFLKKKKFSYILNIKLSDLNFLKMFENLKKKVHFFLKIYKFLKKNVKNKFFKRLPSSFSKIIKIIIISKKYLQVGDKMCGRYGNKGVISKILPVNEMPYLFNGKTIDIILNPLGVPSRMNIGQLLEIHLGFISLCLSWKFYHFLFQNNSILKIKDLLSKIYNKDLEKKIFDCFNYSEILNLVNFLKNGFYFSVTPFSNFKENDINYLLNLIFSDNFLYDFGVSENKKQVYLYDGKTGKKFERPTTIGLMYFLKLNHLAEDKIHSRSVGPYSMITQQPLKGKSNKGGQRLGEMEVWALEAYGAFYSLQEMFTIKSDDISGRFEAYRNIVKGIFKFNFNRPETFSVMLKNINSLSLYIRFNDY